MVESYKEMTLGQLLQMQELKDLNASDAVKELMFISILSGKSTDELRKMSNADYAELQNKVRFLADTTPDDIQPASEVTINRHDYTITDEAAKFTAGQYIDFVSHTQNGDGLIDLLSCLIVPKGHEYAEGYDIEKVKADITDLPLPIANYISFFWRASLTLYATQTAREAKRLIRKLPRKQRMQMRPLKSSLKLLLRNGGASLRRFVLDLVTLRRKHRD